MLNDKKIKSGIIKIVIAVSLAFTGPVVFVLASNDNNELIILNIIGGLMMVGCVYFGLQGIKTILSIFFDNSNE